MAPSIFILAPLQIGSALYFQVAPSTFGVAPLYFYGGDSSKWRPSTFMVGTLQNGAPSNLLDDLQNRWRLHN